MQCESIKKEGIDVAEQITLYKKEKPQDQKIKKNWENRFQRWSNKEALFDDTTSNGKCGYSQICDYCTDNHYGRPCVRALNEMLRTQGLKIDYEKADCFEVWTGKYFRNKN